MSEITVDYLIIGQGLAGSCVAWQLMKRGKRIAVIDQPGANRCTAIAAGLFNPVTGQKLMKTWMAQETFDYLHQFYPEVEQSSGIRFFNSVPIYRPFNSVEEQNEWMARTVDPDYASFLQRVDAHSQYEGLEDSLGGITLKRSGNINTLHFMDAVRRMVIEKGLFLDEQFQYDQLRLEADLRYRNLVARKVIFCEGHGAARNPWFSKLPHRPLKGETVEIKSDFREHVIINRGVYMVPANRPGEWKVGSTYNVQDKIAGNTEKGISELTEKLNHLIKSDFEIIKTDWGIRPTTVDRRPVLGAHPSDDRVVIFNGLGTKGVSLAPYFSDILVRRLENGIPVAKEVDVTRFKVLS